MIDENKKLKDELAALKASITPVATLRLSKGNHPDLQAISLRGYKAFTPPNGDHEVFVKITKD